MDYFEPLMTADGAAFALGFLMAPDGILPIVGMDMKPMTPDFRRLTSGGIKGLIIPLLVATSSVLIMPFLADMIPMEGMARSALLFISSLIVASIIKPSMLISNLLDSIGLDMK